MKISVIVPLYYGEKYIKDIMEQIDENAKILVNHEVELIFYNDSPQQKIEIEQQKNFLYEIKLIQSDYNRGIHGARVQALRHAIGEYVLFLDQDDRISEKYLYEQISCIGDADAVVCRAIHNKRNFYTRSFEFEKVITKDFMLEQRCPIISPGQVLIKKTAIPQMWKDHILKTSGADDYFLWLLMMAFNKKFVLNEKVLFEHVINGVNASYDTNKMMDSELEMLEIVQSSKVFNEADTEKLGLLSVSLRKSHVKELDNYRRMYCFWKEWCKESKNNNIFLNTYRQKSIAIYGAGEFGRSLKNALDEEGVYVSFFIDQNAEFINETIPVYTLDAMPNGVAAIITTIKSNELKKKIQHIGQCCVYDVEEILCK